MTCAILGVQGEYRLVFRGASGRIGGKPGIYHLWTSNDVANENSEAAKKAGSGFAGHFKSHILNSWERMNIRNVSIPYVIC